MFYYHIIQVFIEDSYISHKFTYIGSVSTDPPTKSKQPKSPNFENMSKFTQILVKYDTFRFVVYSSQMCLSELSLDLWCYFQIQIVQNKKPTYYIIISCVFTSSDSGRARTQIGECLSLALAIDLQSLDGTKESVMWQWGYMTSHVDHFNPRATPILMPH